MKSPEIKGLATGALLSIFTCAGLFAQSASIRLNQIGFYPSAPKVAVVVSDTPSDFTITDAGGHTLYSGKLKPALDKTFGGKTAFSADFSSFQKLGKYYLKLSDGTRSNAFTIAADVNKALAAGVIKAYYFQRASIPLTEKFAGKWHRAEGHPDDKVLVHPSAVSANRPAGTVISSPRGWYDAGDYNKYIVNSGISMGTMLSLYEDYPAHMKVVKIAIPESGNQLPDLLNELLWNLRWMLTMQDPADGGVYHKLTNAAFDAMIMPDKAIQPRYVVQKSTAATLDFAAVMAQSARILKSYNAQLPGLADSCLKAANKAWQWAGANPAVYYKQDEMNTHFEPAVVTGAYGDNNVTDERIWAACELYITTHNDTYLAVLNLANDKAMPIPSWAQVKLLGYYSLLRNRNKLTAAGKAATKIIGKKLITVADSLVKAGNSNAYQTVINGSKSNFIWGSNSVAANQSIALLNAYQLTHRQQYLTAALSNLDYILGRNATGYSYVTGYGYKTPMHPHHRVSVADGVADPVPGLLAAGANPGMQDHIQVPSTVADEAYIDDDRAYAVNEIAINWNAPLVYLVNAMEALQQQFTGKQAAN